MAPVPNLLLAAALGVAASAAAAEPADTVLETDALALRLRSAPALHLASLVHRASGVELLDASAPAPLFTLSVGPEGAGGRDVSSLEARRSSVQASKTDTETRVVLTYGDFPVAGLEAEATVTVPVRGPLTTWTLALRFAAPTVLRAVRFPQVVAVPAIGEAADDVFVLPSLPGALIRNPAQAWGANQVVWLKYPGDLSAQFVAYQDPAAGLYLASQDAGAHPRRLGISRRPTGFAVAHEYTLDSAPVSEWQSPYPCVLGVTQGSWCDTADLYKAWAVAQPWCRLPLARRDDVPAWWKAGPLVHVCEVRTYDAKGVQSGSFYPALREHVATLRRHAEGDIVLMLAGWEQHRRWSAGDYFPIFDEATARPLLAEFRAAGVRPFVFLSGLFWTFDNAGRNASQPPVPDTWRPAFVRDPKTGAVQEFTLGESSPERPWERHSYQFCVTPAATREFLHQVVDRTHDLGIDLVQMDQTTSGGGAACASPDHGHPVGPGAYQTQAFVDLLGDLRAYGKSRSPDFVLLHEEPHEELIPVLDGFHVREYKERWWYRSTPGAVGIPLFSYLYHEYAIGYGGDNATLNARPDPFCVRMQAVNLVTGRTPGVSVWTSQSLLAAADPAPLSVLHAHTRLLQHGGAPFLMLGRMLHPLRLDVPDTTYQMSVKGKDGWQREPFVEPSVLTSSWEAPDGRIAHLFVNPTTEVRALRVGLDTRNGPAWPAAAVQVYSSTAADPALQPLATGVPLPYRLTRDLAPLEVLFVVLGVAAEGEDMPLALVGTNAHDVEMRALADGAWEIRTTGGDPYVFTAAPGRSLDPAATSVLAFDFFSTTGTDGFQVFGFPPLDEAHSAKGPGLAHSEGWSAHALDVRPLLEALGGRADGFRLDFGNAPGKVLQMRNLRLRAPTERERELAAVRVARQERQARLDRFLRDYLARAYPGRVSEVRVDDRQITVRGQTGGERDCGLAEVPLDADLDDPQAIVSVVPIEPAADGSFAATLPRHEAGRDRLLCRWALVRRSGPTRELLSWAHYPDEVAAKWDLPEAKPRGRKGLGGFTPAHPVSDLDDLGIATATVNLVLNALVSTGPGTGWTPFEYAGRTWYANDDYVASLDRSLGELARRGIVTSVIVLIGQPGGAPKGSYGRLLAHPDADPAGIFAMPDVTSREGLDAYAAGLDFLARRYSDPAAGHGRIHHWILHNEVNAGWVWTNAGQTTDVVYLDLYQKSLRTAWLIARQYDPHSRVFISLEHHWTMHQDPRSHPGRDLLELLVAESQAEGDFEWAIAFHPYPQDLSEPRVWEDHEVRFDFETPKITFKNLEVLDAWVRQPRTFYRGRPRTVHLTEQGLNSRDYSETHLRDQAAGMAYTWAKLKHLDTIEAFDYHNWVDNRHEGGLRIGLRRFPDDPDDPLGRKPIWTVYQALDTPREAEATAFALPLVGVTDWDAVRHRDPIPAAP